MKLMPILLTTLVLGLGLGGCGSGSKPDAAGKPGDAAKASADAGPGKLTVKFKLSGQVVEKSFEVKKGVVKPLDITPTVNGTDTKLAIHEIVLTSYDFNPADLTGRYPKAEGDVMVMIQVMGEKGAPKTTPLKAGNFPTATQADGAEIAGKAWNVIIKLHKDGGIKTASLAATTPQGTRKGQVRLNSADGKRISGEVDLGDDYGSVQGRFAADVK